MCVIKVSNNREKVSPVSGRDRRLWTFYEVLQLTGYSASTIKRALATGELQSVRPGERRIVHSELVRWLGYDPLRELMNRIDPD